MTRRPESAPAGVDRLAREVAKIGEAESAARASRRAVLRGRLVAAATGGTSRPAPLRAIALGIVAVAAAVLLWWSVPRSTSLEARLDGQPIQEDGFVQAGEQARTVEFSDGTRVNLDAGGAMRLDRFTPAGARVVLESGSVEAEVMHRDGTQWSVEAGPYSVRVTGTHFTVRWDPDRDALEVVLSEGSVEVTGPGIEGSRRVAAGERVELGGSREAAEPEEPAEVTSTDAVDDEEHDESAVEPAGAAVEPAESAVEPAESAVEPARGPREVLRREPVLLPDGDDERPDWHGLVEARRYREGIAMAREQGLERICAEEPARGLLRLADAARFARDADAGTMILGCVRERFPSSQASAEAAFFLGRIALESRDGRAAARWLDLSLSEGGGGPFTEQAAGLSIEARELAGDTAGARSAARAYLDRYPRGIHAEVAERLAREGQD